MMLFTKYLIQWKRIAESAKCFNSKSFLELDKDRCIYLSNAPLNMKWNYFYHVYTKFGQILRKNHGTVA